jgi:hypothetical protein
LSVLPSLSGLASECRQRQGRKTKAQTTAAYATFDDKPWTD